MKNDRVNQYFSEHAVQWGKHYQGAGIWLRLFNSIFRRALRYRWEITMKHSFPVEGKTYLDIGCGTGIYSLAIAEAGAKQVTGIDFAEGMIELSRQSAAGQNLSDRCSFIRADFMDMEFDQKFDMVIAMGVFDYIEDYKSLWEKMVSVSSGIAIGSFPGHAFPRKQVRKMRYLYKGLPVYFYSRQQVESLGTIPGLKRYELEDLGSGFVLAGFVK